MRGGGGDDPAALCWRGICPPTHSVVGTGSLVGETFTSFVVQCFVLIDTTEILWCYDGRSPF